MEKGRMQPKPRYFHAPDKKSPSPAVAVAAGNGKKGMENGPAGIVKNKNKKFQKKKKLFKKKGDDDGDVFEGGDEGQGQENGGLDTEEISALVNKLGLSKFVDGMPKSKKIGKIVPSSSTEVKSSLKDSKKKKEAVKIPSQGIEREGSKGGKAVNKSSKAAAAPGGHIRFDEETEGGNSSEKKGKSKGKNKRKQGQGERNGSGSGNNNDANSIVKRKAKLVGKLNGSKWYQEEEGGEEKDKDKGVPNPPGQINHEELLNCQRRANNLLNEDVEAYKHGNAVGSNKSDFQWMEKMMKTGTLPDRMAAFTVRIQDSPAHNLYYLNQLISMVKVQGKQQCLMAADTLRELFLEDLLPPDRKLMSFTSRGSLVKTASKKQLIMWIFEDRLKTAYVSYIEAVKRMASDTVEKLRGKGIAIIYQLLVSNAEQEEVLLQILVNKLGDPVKKMASRALYYLKQLLNEHPRMKRVVVDEAERLLFRNNISKRAQYYGICFLNLIDLKDKHASLAHKLITVYIAFFKSCVKTGDVDTKMMSGLLTGINRAFPQAKEFGFQFTENLDTLYKIVRLSQFTISIQALCILFQIVDVAGNPGGADRFYRVLYEKLIDPEFKMSSHNAQFLNLVFKAMKADTSINRVTGFTKRLLQICQNCPANLACAILSVLSEVTRIHPNCIKIGSTIDTESLNDEDVTISDSEDSDDEVKKKEKSNLDQLMKSTNIQIQSEPVVKKTNSAKESRPVDKVIVQADVIPSSDPPTVEENSDDVKPNVERIRTSYDPYARNPNYCGAEVSLSFELMALRQHFHPSVSLFANTLIQRKSIKYDGNPFKDFTLTRFLERFSYRNAKISKNQIRYEYQPKGLRNVPVNSDDYLATDEERIPIEEKFFYRFFKTKKVKEENDDAEEESSDVESIGDDEFDSLMDNYFKSVKGGELSDEEEGGDLDFASGVLAKNGKKRSGDEESASEDEDEDGSDVEDDGDEFISLDDNDDPFGDDEEGDLSDDEYEEGMFEDGEEPPMMNSKKRKNKSAKGTDMFAPAEEFAEMLEENAEDVLTGSHTLINRDRADKKQLKWEVDRDRWAKGFSGKRKWQGQGKGSHKGKKFKKN